jgi:urate oxidase
MLGANRYGKSGIRLARVVRDGPWHTFTDVTVDVRLEGDFAAAHVAGDNSEVLPTDTMRATVYALAAHEPVGQIEEFGMRVAARLLEASPAAAVAEVTLVEHAWERMTVEGASHPHAFTGGAPAVRTATVRGSRDGVAVSAGVDDLKVLKTTGSAFTGFLVDEYTVLPETDDRILATTVTADWDYRGVDVDFAETWGEVRDTLLATFAGHDSESVQHTLYAMGEAVLARCGEVTEVRLRMPNLHHVLADLSPYGIDNPNEVFVVNDRPYGVIEATIGRE